MSHAGVGSTGDVAGSCTASLALTPGSGMAISWDSMNGRLRSQSCGGNGPQSGLLLSRTPVYMMVGMPSESSMQQPAAQVTCLSRDAVALQLFKAAT